MATTTTTTTKENCLLNLQFVVLDVTRRRGKKRQLCQVHSQHPQLQQRRRRLAVHGEGGALADTYLCQQLSQDQATRVRVGIAVRLSIIIIRICSGDGRCIARGREGGGANEKHPLDCRSRFTRRATVLHPFFFETRRRADAGSAAYSTMRK